MFYLASFSYVISNEKIPEIIHVKQNKFVYSVYIPDKKKRIRKVSSIFSQLGQIFQLFRLYSSVTQSSTKIHLIQSKSESEICLEIREGSKPNVAHVSVYSLASTRAQTCCTPSTHKTK